MKTVAFKGINLGGLNGMFGSINRTLPGPASSSTASGMGGPARPTFEDLFSAEINSAPAHRARLQSNLGNCGQTSDFIITKLTPLGLTPAFAEPRVFTGTNPGDADGLRALLRQDVTAYTQYNINIDGVHEFTIDKKPSGESRLTQGFMGQYDAFFWVGASDTLQRPTGEEEKKGEVERESHPQASELRIMRDAHKDRDLDINTFADRLHALISLQSWATDDHREEHIGHVKTAWAALPCAPACSQPEDMATKGARGESRVSPIVIKVTTRTIEDPNAAANILGGRDGDFLSPAVIKAAARVFGVS